MAAIPTYGIVLWGLAVVSLLFQIAIKLGRIAGLLNEIRNRR